jgi:hypothetical protein
MRCEILDLTAFSGDELLSLLAPEPTERQCDPDDLPEPPDDAVALPGDLCSWVGTGCSAATAASPRMWTGGARPVTRVLGFDK